MAAVVSGLMAKLESVLWVPAGTTGVARRWRWHLPRQREELSTPAVEAAALRQVSEPPGQQRRAPQVRPRPCRRASYTRTPRLVLVAVDAALHRVRQEAGRRADNAE